jgi:hypothetical protein
MITDKNGHTKAEVEITSDLRDEMVRFIQKRIIRSLKATKQFLQLQDHDDICAGLYTYAVEEYGKILFLTSFPASTGNKIKFPYRAYKSSGKWYGFLAHDEKFSRILEDKDFPVSSKLLSKGDFVPEDFVLGDFYMGLIADMKARMALFYADFKDENSILDPPLIDRSILEKAVNEFLEFMEK